MLPSSEVNRWLVSNISLAWPPPSSDIIHLNFFLWCYVKNKFHAASVTGLEDLKRQIKDVMTTININMLARTYKKNFMYASIKHNEFRIFLTMHNFLLCCKNW